MAGSETPSSQRVHLTLRQAVIALTGSQKQVLAGQTL
jgi:hypothetical protein